MSACEFCNGEMIGTDYVGNGIRPMMVNLMCLGGGFPSHYGIRFEKPNLLCFDNSCGEYAEGQIEISHCPLCGKELKPSDE